MPPTARPNGVSSRQVSKMAAIAYPVPLGILVKIRSGTQKNSRQLLNQSNPYRL